MLEALRTDDAEIRRAILRGDIPPGQRHAVTLDRHVFIRRAPVCRGDTAYVVLRRLRHEINIDGGIARTEKQDQADQREDHQPHDFFAARCARFGSYG